MAKLTPSQITDVYEEIGKMRVTLDADPNRGLQYVKERLTLCRAMQDRMAELTLKASRALSDVWQEALTVRMEHELAPSGPLKQRLRQLDGEKQDHDLLLKMIKMQGQLLARTSMDVRLLADLTKEQIKLGEINPHDAGLVEPLTPADLSPVEPVQPQLPTTEEAQQAAAELSQTIDAENLTGFFSGAEVKANGTPTPQFVETVDLGGPSGIMEGSAKPLPKTEAVNFDDLFGALNGEPVTAGPF